MNQPIRAEKDNWQSFIQNKLEKRHLFNHVGSGDQKKTKEIDKVVTEDSIEQSDASSSISLEKVEEFQTTSASPKKREIKFNQENMIVECTTDSDREILPDRPVSFTDLDYRLDLKTDLFTEREIQIISNAVEMEAHIICLSCVESVEDIREARRILQTARGHHLQIYSKIQSLKGLANIDEIIGESNGIVIARGYLGLSLEEDVDVVYMQRYITNRCNTIGKPVILQTQIMDSMKTRLRPTRSEVCDVAEGVSDGLDGMILSAETATGKFPRETTEAMSQICYETEQNLNYINIY